MKRILFCSLFVLCALAGLCAAETNTLNLTATAQAPFSCFNFSPSFPNCYGIPVDDDGSQGEFWIDNTFIQFLGDYEHLNGAHGLAEVTGISAGPSSASYSFAGVDDSGRAYTGTLVWSFITHRQCGRGCYTIGKITGGKITIAYK